MNAQGEQRHTFGQARGQADVLLDFDDYAVVIEAEFGAPAKADADKRFPRDQPAMVGGLPLRLAVAVGYPKRLADLPESDTDSNLAAAKDLKISYRYYGDEWGAETIGTVASLAEQLRSYWVRSDNGAGIDEIVHKASAAIDEVAEALARLDQDRGREPESPGTKALIWLNALVFQELLARHLDMSLLPSEHREKTITRPDPAGSTADLERQWEEILSINWWPIFHVARETLQATPGSPAARQAMVVLIRTAREIVESGMIRRHDVAGRVFSPVAGLAEISGDKLHHHSGRDHACGPRLRRARPHLVRDRLRFGRVRSRAADRGSRLRQRHPAHGRRAGGSQAGPPCRSLRR